MERLKRAARVILIGAPGVGKGTQTSRLLQQFPQLSGISSGDLLRRNVRLRTAFGKPNDPFAVFPFFPAISDRAQAFKRKLS